MDTVAPNNSYINFNCNSQQPLNHSNLHSPKSQWIIYASPSYTHTHSHPPRSLHYDLSTFSLSSPAINRAVNNSSRAVPSRVLYPRAFSRTRTLLLEYDRTKKIALPPLYYWPAGATINIARGGGGSIQRSCTYIGQLSRGGRQAATFSKTSCYFCHALDFMASILRRLTLSLPLSLSLSLSCSIIYLRGSLNYRAWLFDLFRGDWFTRARLAEFIIIVGL